MGKNNNNVHKDDSQLEHTHRAWVATLDAIRDCVFVIDTNSRLVRANKAFSQLVQRSYSDLLGASVADVLPWLVTKTGALVNHQVVSPEGRLYRLRSFSRSMSIGDCVFILEDITELSSLKNAEEKYHEDSARSSIETIASLAKALDSRDPYTAQHSLRVAYLARNIARRVGFSDTAAQGLFYAAQIHDIGKLTIPTSILSRPGKLFESELNLIKMHPETGYAIVKGLEFPWPVHNVILQHHERLDGSGYPNGLQGDEIDKTARVVAVADVFEAMSASRPYREGLGVDAALAELHAGAGIKYDEQAVEACQELTNDMTALYPPDAGENSVRT